MNSKIIKVKNGILNNIMFYCDRVLRGLFSKRHDYLAIGAIIKNEEPYLNEWIDTHLALGVDCFYLYDNDSTDNTKEILKPYIKNGQVIYHKIKGENRQIKAYNQIIKIHGGHANWIAFIDADEFIYPVPRNGTSTKLDVFLRDYEEYNGIGVNWIMFGTAGHKTKPEGTVIDNYIQSFDGAPVNLHIKTIANMKKGPMFYSSPHTCNFADGEPVVDENKEPMYGNEEMSLEFKRSFSLKHNVNKIACNHYFMKSQEEFAERCKKGKSSGSFEADERYNDGMEKERTSKLADNTNLKDLVRNIR